MGNPVAHSKPNVLISEPILYTDRETGNELQIGALVEPERGPIAAQSCPILFSLKEIWVTCISETEQQKAKRAVRQRLMGGSFSTSSKSRRRRRQEEGQGGEEEEDSDDDNDTEEQEDGEDDEDEKGEKAEGQANQAGVSAMSMAESSSNATTGGGECMVVLGSTQPSQQGEPPVTQVWPTTIQGGQWRNSMQKVMLPDWQDWTKLSQVTVKASIDKKPSIVAIDSVKYDIVRCC